MNIPKLFQGTKVFVNNLESMHSLHPVASSTYFQRNPVALYQGWHFWGYIRRNPQVRTKCIQTNICIEIVFEGTTSMGVSQDTSTSWYLLESCKVSLCPRSKFKIYSDDPNCNVTWHHIISFSITQWYMDIGNSYFERLIRFSRSQIYPEK